MKRARLAAFVALAAGCGGDGYGDDDGAVQDAPTGVDGNVSDASGCNAIVDFEPDEPFAGTMVEAFGDVSGGLGVIDYMWTVTKDGVDVPWVRIEGNERGIKFQVDEPGIHLVSLEVGLGCNPFFGGLNVTALGANNRAVRLRFVPPTTLGAPPQERTIVISGGADYAAGVLTLDRGIAFPITVSTPAAAPVAAYLRFTSRATPDAVVEAFSDGTGNALARLVAGNYDVLVVPTSGALAPRLITNWDPLLAALTIDGGQVLTGTVLDAAGAPVAGAGVSLISGTVPSTIGTTAADGTFSLRWREGGTAEALTVVPPPGGELPRLDATVELGALTDVTVRHTAVPASNVGGTLVQVGGVAAATTDVLVAVSLPASGTVRDGTTVLAQATGSHRRVLTTDATGHLPAATLIHGSGGAFISSAGPGAYAPLALPLTGNLAAPAPVTISGQVEHDAGGGVPFAGVRATLTGPLAHAGAPTPMAAATSQGDFTLSLAAGAPYQVQFSDPSGEDAPLAVMLATATDQVLSSLVLPAALAITGEVRATGTSTGAKSVGIAALCHLDCNGVERARPLGEAVTDATGGFVLTVPDPGVSQ